VKVRTVNALVFLALAALMAFALLYGCASVGVRGDVQELPGLREATALVWTAYGRTDKPPRVRIAQGDDLTCTDPISGKAGFPVLLTSGPGCREGFTISPLETSVSWHGEPWHETALAHELMHVAQGRRGIVDPGHLRIEWSTDVPAAAGLLLARGW
jgi:hypothetical protein